MKAILVIELSADSLPYDAYADVYVYGKYGEDQESDFLAHKKCITLKPMLERHPIIEGRWMYENGTYSEPFGNKEYARGWNDCLKEILGETE